MSGPCHRLAVVASHPIQYATPVYRALAAHPRVDLHVYFCERWGLEEYHDEEFGAKVAWDTPLLAGYSSSFLPNLRKTGAPGRAFGVINPGVLRRLDPDEHDAVLLSGWMLLTQWMTWAAATAKGLPILLRCENNGMTARHGIRASVKDFAIRAFLSRVAACLAIGSRNAQFYRSYGVEDTRIYHSPYSVDNEHFSRVASGGDRRALRKELELPEDLTVFIISGKLTPGKRPGDVLDAIARAGLQDEAAVVFLGDGELRDKVLEKGRELCIAHVRVTGFRNQASLPRYYGMADALVHPSSSDQWGLVLNEAMCAGLPIIATDRVGAAIDLVRPGLNGDIYAVGDIGALADAMAAMVRDPVRRQAMGCESSAIISRWGIPETVEGIVMALDAVTQRGRGAR